MKKKIKITGLDCPNCAKTLENQLSKIEGIKNVKLDFLKSSLVFESDSPEKTLTEIKQITKQFDPQIKIEEKNKKFFVVDLVLLGLGIAIGVLLFFIPLPTWAFWTLYTTSALLLGWKTYLKAIRLLFKGVINENLLITISVVGASFISSHNEGLMVIALYSIGKIFEGLAVNHSRKSIEQLARLQPEYVNVISGDKEYTTSPQDVAIGSTIIVRPGEKIALDGVIIDGTALIDNQSLTGESLPINKTKGNQILSGGVVLDGVLTIKTTSLYSDSTISKIMDLVENAAENKSKTETVISKVTRWYTLGIIILSVLVWAITWAVTKDFNISFYRGLIFLVVSCPCAFAISVPLSYFSGLGNASKNGVLIKGSNFLDACSNLNVVAFDKTGTLTTGKFEIKNITTTGKYSKDQIIYLAALGEQYSIHPLAKAIVSTCNKKLEKVKNVKEIAGKGVQFVYKEKKYFVGRKSALSQTAVELFEEDKKIGQIDLADTVKSDALEACKGLKKLGIKSIMLSGDNKNTVEQIANIVGVDEAVAQMLPQDKYKYIENLKNQKLRVGYVGDGINDAPSLTLSNVGFSMGINGSAASIEASDVVIVDDNPKKILTAIKISKYTKKIVWENICVSALVKIVFLTLGALGITGMLWAVFADVGVTVLAILNSLRALKYKAEKQKN